MQTEDLTVAAGTLLEFAHDLTAYDQMMNIYCLKSEICLEIESFKTTMFVFICLDI